MSSNHFSTPVDAKTRVDLFGLPLDINVDRQYVLDRLNEGSLLLTYLNPYAYSVARLETDYLADLNRFDLIVCDGVGIQKAVRNRFDREIPILTPDFFGIAGDYLEFATTRNLNLCLVGGAPGVAVAAAERLRQQHPGIGHIESFEGFAESPDRARRQIIDTSPAMVLCGMGMGRQEEFLLSLRLGGWNGIGICVGGFLDKLANPRLDYPEWSKKVGMRFLGRLAREPRKMIRRYFWDYRIFLWRYFLSRPAANSQDS